MLYVPNIREAWLSARMGLLRQVVRCQNIDLWPAAMQIADRAVECLEERKDKSKPLILLLGESHVNSAHILVQIFTIELLRQRGLRLSVGHESSYNIVSQIIDSESPLLRQMFAAFAENAIPAPMAYLSDLETGPAKRMFMTYMLFAKISSHFNDVAKIDGNIVTKDPKVSDMLSQHNLESKSTTDKYGLNFRNKFMVSLSLDMIEQQNPDIYIQSCGAAHVFGKKPMPDDPDKFSYNKSLAGLWSKEGYAVLGVPLALDESMMPSDYRYRQSNAIFGLKLPAMEVGRGENRDFYARVEEVYVTELLRASGIDPDGLLRQMRLVKEGSKNIVDKITDEFWDEAKAILDDIESADASSPHPVPIPTT